MLEINLSHTIKITVYSNRHYSFRHSFLNGRHPFSLFSYCFNLERSIKLMPQIANYLQRKLITQPFLGYKLKTGHSIDL